MKYKKEKVKILYASKTGNSKYIAHYIGDYFGGDVIPFSEVNDYIIGDVVLVTYSWGKGDIPVAVREKLKFITGPYSICGTGNSLYPNFCGAVDRIIEILGSNLLLVSAKFELRPEDEEILTFVTCLRSHYGL